MTSRVIPPPSNGSPFDTDYSDARFSYTAPSTPDDAIQKASTLLELRKDVSRDELFNRYLCGKRLLGDNRLAYLIFTEGSAATKQDHAEYIMFLCTAHCTTDSVAFYSLVNEFFTIIAGTEMGYRYTAADLEQLVREEWQARWGSGSTDTKMVLPPPFEDILPPAHGLLKRVAERVDFQNNLRQHIGGHALPRTKGAKLRAVIQTSMFDESTSKAILRTCKARGVSVSNALFAVTALAWSRTQLERGIEPRPDLPIMMDTALNVRPYLPPTEPSESYYMLALGFFNIVLPSFLPSAPRAGDKVAWKSLRSTLWHRARSARAQCAKVTKSPLLISRIRETARLRGRTAKAFAVEDDAKGLGLPMPPRSAPSKSTVQQPPPSTLLLGISHLGNLDGFFRHNDYPSVQLHSIAPAGRSRPGGLLMHSYTFAGKLYLNLVHDANGFEGGVIDAWWKDVHRGIEELLIGQQMSRL